MNNNNTDDNSSKSMKNDLILPVKPVRPGKTCFRFLRLRRFVIGASGEIL
jgi:hypothetical protein